MMPPRSLIRPVGFTMTSMSSASASPSDAAATPHRVLIAEDEALIRLDLAEMLREEGYEIVGEAGDGEEAVEAARSAQPSIVFLDIDMPRLNGIEACRRMRSEPGTAEATIVMLTGDSGDVVERGAQDAGADLFLTKPFSPLHLLRLVDRIGATS